MMPLQNPAIEYPEKVFEVEVLVLGKFAHRAVHRTITVLAQTVKGAKRICKSRYPRIQIADARPVVSVHPAIHPGLFPESEF